MGLVSAFKPPLVGLDLGTHAVRAVALRQKRRGWVLVAAGEAPLPHGEEATQAELADAAAALLDTLGLRRASVAAAVSGHAVIVKRLTMPPMSAEELAETMPLEAEQYIPFPLEDVQLDYEVMEGPRALPADAIDVLLVAARRDRVDERIAAMAATGRAPVILDVEAFALANAYEANYSDRREAFVVLVHIGRRGTIVCLLENGQVAYTRDINIGGGAYRQALERDLGIDTPAAERLMRLARQEDDAAVTVVRDLHQQLMLEIRKTLDFHRASSSAERIDRIVLSGGACQIDGLKDLLAVELETEVEVVDPFRKITRPSRSVGADVEGPAFAVAVGLALRREGDR
jgi:type IV pilus assembly protein PilM